VNYMWLVLIPVYISIIVLLALEWGEPCLLNRYFTIQSLFLLKIILDSCFLLPTFVLIGWIWEIQKDDKLAEEQAQNEPIGGLSGSKRKSVPGLETKRTIVNSKTFRSLAVMEAYDGYTESLLHLFRDFMAIIANTYDLFLVLVFQRTVAMCTMCPLRLYDILTFLARLYLITFIPRLLVGLSIFLQLLIQWGPIKRYVLEHARAFDEENGIHIAQFLVKNILYRESVHKKRARLLREELHREERLAARREKIMRELEDINVQLGIETEPETVKQVTKEFRDSVDRGARKAKEFLEKEFFRKSHAADALLTSERGKDGVVIRDEGGDSNSDDEDEKRIIIRK